MKEKTNTSKLDTPLAHDKLAKTCTPKKEVAPAVASAPTLKIKFKLKFTDYAIEKFMSSFSVPPKKRVVTPYFYKPFLFSLSNRSHFLSSGRPEKMKD